MSVLALPDHYDRVSSIIGQIDPTILFEFGWRSPSKREEGGPQSEIDYVPGDHRVGANAPSENMGLVTDAVGIGWNPRSVATLNEVFTVFLWAFDPKQSANERAQYEKTRMLYDMWLAASFRALEDAEAVTTFRVTQQEWVTAKEVVRAGACIRAVCTIECAIPEISGRRPTVGDVEANIVATFRTPDLEGDAAITAVLVVPPEEL